MGKACRLWLDNLYLRAVGIGSGDGESGGRRGQYIVLGIFAPLQGMLKGLGQRYVTRTTFQGDGAGPALGIYTDESTYVESAPLPCSLHLSLCR